MLSWIIFMQDTDSIFLLGKSVNLERVPLREYQGEDLLQNIVDSSWGRTKLTCLNFWIYLSKKFVFTA